MTRFSLFQVVSAYTNTGMSLVDQSMIPFQTAYLMIIFMIFLIMAGNTAFVSLPSIYFTHFPYFPPHFQPILYVTKVALLPLCLSVSFAKSLRLLMRVSSRTSLLQLSQIIVLLVGVSARLFARLRGYTRHCSSYWRTRDDVSYISSHPIKHGFCSRSY